MRRILLLLLLLLPIFIKAQTTTYQDVVYLNNGSIIRGMIIEEVPNQTIKIQTADGSVFVYQYSEIEKITKEAVKVIQPNNPIQPTQTIDKNYCSGYINYTELFYGYNINESNISSYGLKTSNGYQYKQLFSIGVCLSLFSIGGVSSNSLLLMPISLDTRFNFTRNRSVNPYVSFDIGYSEYLLHGSDYSGTGAEYYNQLNSVDGGLFVNPSVGISVMLSKKNAINIGLGYVLQQVTLDAYQYNYVYTYNGNNYYYTIVPTSITINETYHFVQLNIGFSF